MKFSTHTHTNDLCASVDSGAADARRTVAARVDCSTDVDLLLVVVHLVLLSKRPDGAVDAVGRAVLGVADGFHWAEAAGDVEVVGAAQVETCHLLLLDPESPTRPASDCLYCWLKQNLQEIWLVAVGGEFLH